MVETNPEPERQTTDAFSTISKVFSTNDVRQTYKFLKVIGGGHFGTVRLATPKNDPHNIVAVKSILKESIKKDIRHLEEELFILRTVDHPNIIKFHQSFIDHRYVHIIMQYCQGGELFDRIVSNTKFNENYAASLMSQMLSAVKHLHDAGIVHRDLCPENYLMADKSELSEVKLIDFGLSKRYQAQVGGEKMHTVVGTPYYVAPEVLKGNYAKECDVWSLGVILYVFLCGYPPFEGDSNTQIFKNILGQPLKFDPKDWDGVSDEAKDSITQMLERDAASRITCVGALSHTFFQKKHTETFDKDKILQRIRDFRAPLILQQATLQFLANARYQEEGESEQTAFDFAGLRKAFRALDTQNTGTLLLDEIKEAFKGSGLSETEVNDIFTRLDTNCDGEINYSEFLAAAINKEKVVTNANLNFAFHHFDVDNTGYITAQNLQEAFKRQGKNFSIEEVTAMVEEINPASGDKISMQEFIKMMQEVNIQP